MNNLQPTDDTVAVDAWNRLVKVTDGSDGPHYYTQGANYHTLAITDDSGTVLERYHYDPYGQSTILEPNFTPDPDNTSDIGNAYTFTGRRLDPESGLHYFRNRYYDIARGRFMSRDPMQYIDGGNLYSAYFAPNQMDPYGLGCWLPCAGVPVALTLATAATIASRISCSTAATPQQRIACAGAFAGALGSVAAAFLAAAACMDCLMDEPCPDQERIDEMDQRIRDLEEELEEIRELFGL